MGERATPRKRGRAGQRDRARRLKLYPLCALCLLEGIVTQTDQIDHIIPLHKGGPDTDENCQGICLKHHEAKTLQDTGRKLGYDSKGFPLNSDHPWSKNKQGQ